MLARVHHEDRSVCFLAASAYAADLTGNWVVAQDMHDGTERRTYFDLKQDGDRIAGHIRATQFYYSIKESKGGPEAFTVVGSMMDGRNERTVTYQGKLQSDELHVAAVARTGTVGSDMVAHRTAAGDGAYPNVSSCPRCTRSAITALPKLRRWVGTVGTNSTAAWMTHPCAEWPMPSPPME
jgi:hypothetical protein